MLLRGILCLLLCLGCTSEKDKPVPIEPPKEPTCLEILEAKPKTDYTDPFYLQNLLRAKGTPVTFLREPKQTEDISELAKKKRIELIKRNPYKAVRAWKRQLTPAQYREVFLSEGYLFSKNHRMVQAFIAVRADHLFDDKYIWVQRGNHTYHAKLRENKKWPRYYFTNGPLRRKKVSLLLYDRVGTDTPPAPLHIDLRLYRDLYGAKTFELKWLDDDQLIGLADKGTKNERLIFSTKDGEMLCQTKDVEIDRSKYDGLQALRTGALHLIDEYLPFDEPRTEFGQQDGRLRTEWSKAYYGKKKKYKFNGDEYRVFNQQGMPWPPQVCVDFLVDSIDRAAGSWYRHKRYRRGRQTGSLRLGHKDHRKKKNKPYALRNVNGFTKFAEDHPEWFRIINVDGIPMGSNTPFIKQVGEFNLIAGDIVFIKGRAKWDNYREIHWHSFIIMEHDPVTGFPILFAGNAGPASLRPWWIEMARTPKRRIVRIIRPQQAFYDLIAKDRKNILSKPFIVR